MKRQLLGVLLVVAVMSLAACAQEPTATLEPAPTTVVPVPTATPALPMVTPTPEAPSGGATVRITPGSLTVAPGDLSQVVVEIVLGDVGLSAVDLTLSFDPRGMRVIAVEPGSLLGTNPIAGVERIDQEAGEVRIALARVGSTQAPTTGGALFSISLQVHEGATPGATLPLRLTGATLVDEAFEELSEVRLEDGEVRVSGS